MLYNNQIEKLEAFLNGPLLNEKILIIRVLPTIIRNLQRSNLSEPEIQTISKVIIAGFPENRIGGSQDFCYRVIHDVFKNQGIPDHTLSSLVRCLSAEPKVSLSKAEIKSIAADIHAGNHSVRSELLKQFVGKSKTMVRWLSSSVEDLQREAESLEAQEAKPEIQAGLYSILIKKLADDKGAKNGRDFLEALQKFANLKVEKHSLNLAYYINMALKKCLMDGQLEEAKELWEMKRDTTDEIKIMYILGLLEKREAEGASAALTSLEDFPGEQVLIHSIRQTNCSFETIEKFIQLVYRKFSPLPIIRKRLTTELKRMELEKAIADDNLQLAFHVASTTSELFKSAFGQSELMNACILKGEKALLSNIFDCVVKFHDRNTASIDLMVAFLECGNFHSAEQVFSKAGNLYISAQKMDVVTTRELELKRPDVLRQLFLLFNDPDSSSSIDLVNMITECMNLYATQGNAEGLKELRNDIEKAHFGVDGKVKAHLEGLIAGVYAKKNAESKASSACTSRNNSIFERRESTKAFFESVS